MMPRWFRKKTFGYGWTPCTWQGWLVMAVFTAGIVATALPRFHLDVRTRLTTVFALVVALLIATAFTSGKDSDA